MHGHRRCRVGLLGLALLLTAPAARAGDWPQWLGPTRQGVSDEEIKPWEDAPKVLWRVPVGEGHSSPVVADGRVFLHTKVPGREAEAVLAFDAKSGEKLWEKTYERAQFATPFGNGPRSTPCVDGRRIYTLGITGVLSCFDAQNGGLHWRVDTLKQFGAKNLVFGVSTSPLIYHDRVFVMVGGKGASVVAFEKDTGKVAWKAGDDPASYSSPILWHAGMPNHLVFLTGAHLMSLEPDGGKVVWRVPFRDRLNESSTTPVRVGDKLVASSVTAGSIGVDVQTKDGESAAEPVWKNPALTCYFSTPVVVGSPDSHLYMVTGEAKLLGATADLHCVDAKTGKSVWKKPKVGAYHASLLRLADGKVLMLEDDGELVLLDGGVKEYKELAHSKVCGKTWAHPALAHGRLYLRDDRELICLEMGK
ncbi:MAG TPA: PQQ-binding-like beta-propeller repeat protein [Gemmataceae bacterium]